jgi:hypothetical protein
VIDGEGIVTRGPLKRVLASGTSDRRHRLSLPMSKGVGRSCKAQSRAANRRPVARDRLRRREIPPAYSPEND